MNAYSLLTALFAGISAGCTFWYLAKVFSSLELEKQRRNTEKRIPLVFQLVLPFLGLVRGMTRSGSFNAWRKSVEVKLGMAGYSSVFSPEDFIAIKLIFWIIALILVFAGVLSGSFMICFLMGVLAGVYPSVWLQATIKSRQLSIMKALPNLLDLLTLSVESGRDLLSSLRDILARRRPDALGEELIYAFQEIQLGRKRSEALKAMAERVRQIDLTATVNAIVQADELGVSIGQQLRIQSDMQRAKRFSLAEKLANEASVKIIIPVVLFILPAVFIILLGPLLLQTARMFQ